MICAVEKSSVKELKMHFYQRSKQILHAILAMFWCITSGIVCPISTESLSALWATATGAMLTCLCTSMMTDSM